VNNIESTLNNDEKCLSGGDLIGEVIALVGHTKNYIDSNSNNGNNGAEIVHSVVAESGDLLDLMGFTIHTSRPETGGVAIVQEGINNNKFDDAARVLREFREDVRKLSLKGDLNKGEFLKLCDDVRDENKEIFAGGDKKV